jgi:hypothetical protein
MTDRSSTFLATQSSPQREQCCRPAPVASFQAVRAKKLATDGLSNAVVTATASDGVSNMNPPNGHTSTTGKVESWGVLAGARDGH